MGIDKIPIDAITPNSIAEEVGIEKGDMLVSVNGQEIEDILEYKFLISDEYIVLELEKANGEIWEIDIEKDYDEDLGLEFHGLMDEQKTCNNKCIFCFIDQLPKGMRETLYFKDDDTRLSFLQGNFVTLTNMKDDDIDRIIKYRISPINVSIHTTDMELRKRILNNKNAGNLIKYLKKLKDGDIEIKGQIVLCLGINDGEQLDRTIKDLYEFYPQLSCIAIVPVGLTKYREGLYPLRQYEEERAYKVIKQVERMQEYFLKKIGTRFVFLSDEFYVIASKALPDFESYEGFPQLENGVGIIRAFQSEIESSLKKIPYKEISSVVNKEGLIITGEYGGTFLQEMIDKIKSRFPGMKIDVQVIKNDFFGSLVKVAGLVTGKDIVTQLRDKDIPKNIFIPCNMLRDGDDVFLDDLTIEDVEKILGANIIVCREDGSDLIENIFSNSL